MNSTHKVGIDKNLKIEILDGCQAGGGTRPHQTFWNHVATLAYDGSNEEATRIINEYCARFPNDKVRVNGIEVAASK